jgi:hypothetical protein
VTARVQEGQTAVRRSAHPAVFDWRISLSLAEQTMLAEIVLPALRQSLGGTFVQELDKNYRPRSNAWIRDPTSYAFEDDEAFCRRTGGPV